MNTLAQRDAQAARLVDFISAYTTVKAAVVNHEIAIHLDDPTRASDIATMLGLLKSKDYPLGPKPFTLHHGRLDGTDVVLFGALLTDGQVAA